MSQRVLKSSFSRARREDSNIKNKRNGGRDIVITRTVATQKKCCLFVESFVETLLTRFSSRRVYFVSRLLFMYLCEVNQTFLVKNDISWPVPVVAHFKSGM
jgi:hypothetical protein